MQLRFLLVFFPLATIRWYRCLVFVTAQPSQKAWEKNRTFKENGGVWAEIREWAAGGTEETRGHPRRGLEMELCHSWGLRKTLTSLCGEISGRRAQFLFLPKGIEPENGHLSQQYVRGQWKRRILPLLFLSISLQNPLSS